MALENAAVRGVLTHYGTRTTDQKRGGQMTTGSAKKQLKYTFDFDDLPGGSTDEISAYIPAGGRVVDAYLKMNVDYAGATTPSLDIGLIQSDDSTAIDLDGLFDGITPALANAGAVASEDAGTNSGALIGVELAAKGYLKVAVAAGTITAGSFEIVIDYMD